MYVWATGRRTTWSSHARVTAAGARGEPGVEQPSFVYLDSRDLTGFIDGTENPPVHEAPAAAVVAEGPGSGGSFVFLQRWVHDLGRFHARDPR